jgi:hypothetical protein
MVYTRLVPLGHAPILHRVSFNAQACGRKVLWVLDRFNLQLLGTSHGSVDLCVSS